MPVKCLVLDHDDTAVDSTASVHYPAHVEVMKRLRPEDPVIGLEEWFEKNFHPGIVEFLTGEVGFTPEEMEMEFTIWQEFNEDRNPPFYEGLPELLSDFTGSGGILAVASHSTEKHIRRHYENGAPGVEPRFVFGWNDDPAKRKPSAWPLLRIIEETGLDASEILVVDDLKPGVEMARAAGARVAAAGWGHAVPSIREAMEDLCDLWLPDIAALRAEVL